MRKTENRQGSKAAQNMISLLFGGLLALGIALVVLLLGSIAVSAGILKPDTAMQVTTVACIFGGVIGGSFTCVRWGSRRLPAGMLTGLLCFAFIIIASAMSEGELKIGTQGLVEFAGCVVGGGLAGLLSAKGKKKRSAR